MSKKTILFQTIVILILKKDIVSSNYIHKSYILSIITPFQSKSHPTEQKAFLIFASKYLITNKKRTHEEIIRNTLPSSFGRNSLR